MSQHSPVRRRGAWRIALVTAGLAAVLAVLPIAPALAFPDVPAGYAYEEAINGLSSLGVVGGYSSGDFRPDDAVKRAQFAKMIVGSLGIIPEPSGITRFTDLGTPDANGYPHKYVQAAYENGITHGTDAAQTLFTPWSPIRHDQVVSMIVRGAESLFPGTLRAPPPTAPSLFDGAGEPHGRNLRIAEHNGILEGLMGMGPEWSVTAYATRGEVAHMLWNLLALIEGGSLPPSGEVWVYADGSGDYPTLEAAVAAIERGTTIHLGPGAFLLTRPLYVDFSFDLTGVGSFGADASVVEFPGTVVGVYGASFSARNVCFLSTSTYAASDVLWARDAEIYLESCYFSGAWFADEVGGSGIVLTGNTIATVRDCISTFNDWHGIAVDDYAHARLENNLCYNNGGDGIGFWGYSTGAVLGNSCDANFYNGMAADGNAEVSFVDNTCSLNGGTGLGFYAYATGKAAGNTSNANGTGIYVCARAYADVSGNTCDDNTDSGIWFDENAGGTIKHNQCAGNLYGLRIAAGSRPYVGANDLSGNTYDLYYEASPAASSPGVRP